MPYGTWLRASPRPTGTTYENRWLGHSAEGSAGSGKEGRSFKRGVDWKGKRKDRSSVETNGERWGASGLDDLYPEFGKSNQQEGIEGISSNKIGALSSKGSNHEDLHAIMGTEEEEKCLSIAEAKRRRTEGM